MGENTRVRACARMFTAAVLVTAPQAEITTCPRNSEWTHKVWCGHTRVWCGPTGTLALAGMQP